MQRVAEELGVDATNDQLQEMLDDADTQGVVIKFDYLFSILYYFL